MRLIVLIIIAVNTICFLPGCGSGSGEKDKTNGNDTTKNSDQTEGNQELQKLKVKFVDFHLGDASHFVFVDEGGKEWEFADIEDTSLVFAVELPESQADETNQGWAPNKTLVGKWFEITYAIRRQPQYTDGPMVDVKVITAVKAVE